MNAWHTVKPYSKFIGNTVIPNFPIKTMKNRSIKIALEDSCNREMQAVVFAGKNLQAFFIWKDQLSSMDQEEKVVSGGCQGVGF